MASTNFFMEEMVVLRAVKLQNGPREWGALQTFTAAYRDYEPFFAVKVTGFPLPLSTVKSIESSFTLPV